MEAAKEAVEILEDDDDFEEFEVENTGEHDMVDKEMEAKQWNEDWEDEEVDDDFTVHLRQEIESNKK
jgi:26 proteasome complex subunit DSS1